VLVAPGTLSSHASVAFVEDHVRTTWLVPECSVQAGGGVGETLSVGPGTAVDVVTVTVTLTVGGLEEDALVDLVGVGEFDVELAAVGVGVSVNAALLLAELDADEDVDECRRAVSPTVPCPSVDVLHAAKTSTPSPTPPTATIRTRRFTSGRPDDQRSQNRTEIGREDLRQVITIDSHRHCSHERWTIVVHSAEQ
jgi:hypothetical protein